MHSSTSAGASLPPDPSHPQKRKRRRHTPSCLPLAPSSPSSSSHCPPSPTRTRRPPLGPLLPLALLLLLLAVLPAPARAAQSCLRFADYDSINQLLSDGGPGAKVLLCPSKVYRLSGTITFTAADQEIATYGYPTGSERATLRIEGSLATAIQGDCRRCARVGIKSLVIDGNRAKLKRVPPDEESTGLIVLGGNEGQTVRSCHIRDPRGFTAIHVREGDSLQCKGAVIEKNEIGPVGEEYVPAIDGDDPELSPLGRPLADGVSIACRDSIVRDNTFYDNTDAAVVIYGSPGTKVETNLISARERSAIAGVLAVDYAPFEGDYTGVSIKGNVIDAAARLIRVGVGVGAAIWSDDVETVVRGGSVLANGFKGKYMGYSIAMSGAADWTVLDNWDESTHRGTPGPRCFEEVENPPPTSWLYDKKSVVNAKLQPGFVDSHYEYIVCIDLADEAQSANDHSRPAPVDPVAKPNPKVDALSDPASAVAVFSTGSKVMDEILEHSQQRMLEALEHLNRRVDVLASNVNPQPAPNAAGELFLPLDSRVSLALNDLQDRIVALEHRQHALIEQATALRNKMDIFSNAVSASNEWLFDMLLDVQRRLQIYLSAAPAAPGLAALPLGVGAGGAGPGDALPKRTGRTIKGLTNRARLLAELGVVGAQGVIAWASVLRLMLGQAVLAGAWLLYRRWTVRNLRSKIR